MKASKFFKLKQKWSKATITEITKEEVIKPIEDLVEEVKEVKTTIKKKKNETITE